MIDFKLNLKNADDDKFFREQKSAQEQMGKEEKPHQELNVMPYFLTAEFSNVLKSKQL